MKLIGLTGLPRAGKNLFATHLVENHGYVELSFAAPLKAASAVLLGMELWQMNGEHNFDREAILPEWGFSTRDFLQRFGTEAMRNNFGQDFWLKHMHARIRAERLKPLSRIVITDVRFENEASLVRQLGGKIIEITRNGTVRSAHPSDRGVMADVYVPNSGTKMELWEHADAHA